MRGAPRFLVLESGHMTEPRTDIRNNEWRRAGLGGFVRGGSSILVIEELSSGQLTVDLKPRVRAMNFGVVDKPKVTKATGVGEPAWGEREQTESVPGTPTSTAR